MFGAFKSFTNLEDQKQGCEPDEILQRAADPAKHTEVDVASSTRFGRLRGAQLNDERRVIEYGKIHKVCEGQELHAAGEH